MLGTRKELDEHVHKMLAKLPPGRERDIKGWAVGRMYFKINEYAKAIEYLNSYLKVKEEAAACKLIANCYKLQKTPDYRRALEFYQRSIQLNPKQPDVIIEACQLIVKHSSLYSQECADYWLDLAESTQDLYDKEVIFELRSIKSGNSVLGSSAGNGNSGEDSMEQIIQRELLARPKDVKMRIRLVQNFIEKKRLNEAFQYAYKVELEEPGQCNSSDWYDVLWGTLNRRGHTKGFQNDFNDWSFWHLMLITLDRSLYFSLKSETNGSLAESVAQLFRLDFYIDSFSRHADSLSSSSSREYYQCCLDHYTGQLLLHSATLLFKRELMGNKNKWATTVRHALPLLLLGYQKKFVKEDKTSHWQRQCNSDQHNLLKLWRHQAAFRSAQLGRTLHGCVQTPSTDANDQDLAWQQTNQSQRLWSNSDELLSTVRQHCVDPQWRQQLYQQLFTHPEHKLKDQTSYLARDQRLQQPLYEWPSLAEIEAEEQEALLLAPPTLEQHVYLALGTDNLAEAPRIRCLGDMRHDCYQGLSYCGSDSISQLDVEVFLYAVVLQVKRRLQVQRESYNSFHAGNAKASARPTMLPFANTMGRDDLITEEQFDWWTMVLQLQKCSYLTDNGNCIEQREHLQLGIEAVRGVKGPHAELFVVLQLAKLLSSREDRHNLELRIETLYKLGIQMMRSHQQQQLEPFYRFFKYANPLETSVWLKTKELIDDAARYLSNRMFKLSKYEEFLDKVRGLESPMIAYLRSEAYRLLAESSRTSRVSRINFQDRRLECLRQTKQLLANDLGHPLVSLVQRELKSCQSDESYSLSEQQQHNNSSTYEDAEDEFYAGTTNPLNRSRRQAAEPTTQPATTSPALKDVEDTVKEMSKQLCSLKDGMDEMRQEIKLFNDKFSSIEELLKKWKISSGGSASRETPTAADVETALGLEEFLNMEEALQPNYLNGVQANAPDRFFSASGNANHPNAAAFGNPLFNQNQMYNYYASQAQFMRTPPAPGAIPPNFFGPRGPANYGLPPNMFPNPAAGAPYIDGLNYGMPTQPPASLVMPQVSQAQTLAQAPQVQSNLQIASSGNFFGNTFTPSPIQVPQVPAQQPPQVSVSATTLVPPKTTTSVQTSVSSIGISTPSVFGALSSTPLQAAATSATAVPLAPAAPLAAAAPFAPAAPLAGAAIAPLTATAPFAATATSTPSVVFNRAHNNQPVEKEPPANVVITSSDPLPKPAVSSAQPTLSVTIPPQHIKPSIVQANTEPTATPSLDFNFSKTNNTGNIFSGFSSTFSFKTQVAQAAAEKEKEREAEAAALNESVKSEQNQSSSHDTTAELDYDPRPDFKGIIPLPAEVEVHTGEEDEEVKFSERAKLFRHVENEWKERGIGNIKILKNKSNGSSRILMRREQTHKICANHKITTGMQLTVPLQDKEMKSFLWIANDFADEKLQVEKFLVRFKQPSTAAEFKAAFEKEASDTAATTTPSAPLKEKALPFVQSGGNDKFATSTPAPASAQPKQIELVKGGAGKEAKPVDPVVPKSLFGNSTIKTSSSETTEKSSPFANFTFGNSTNTTKTSSSNFSFGGISTMPQDTSANSSAAFTTAFNFGSNLTENKEDSTLQTANTSGSEVEKVDEYVPTAQFEPVIPLPELINVVTGEENELILFEHRAKLLRFDKETNEWKERGLGNMKVLQLKSDPSQVRLLMRREQVLKLCCNQRLLPETKFSYIKNSQNSLSWAAQDYSEESLVPELLCVRFKTAETCKAFYDVILKAQANVKKDKSSTSSNESQQQTEVDKNKDEKPKGFGDAFKPKAGSWSCQGCYTSNDEKQLYCLACEAPKDDTVPPKPQKLEQSGALNLSSSAGKFSFGFAPSASSSGGFSFGSKPDSDSGSKSSSSMTASVAAPSVAPAAAAATAAKPIGFGDAFKPKEGSWSCKDCYTSNDASQLHCLACQAPKDETVPKKDNKLDTSGGITFPATTSKFTFGFGAPTAAATPASIAPASTPAGTAAAATAPTPAAPAATSTAVSTPFASFALNCTSIGDGSVFGSSSFNFKPPGASVTPASSGFGSSNLTSNTFSFSMPKVQTQQPKSPAAVSAPGASTSNNDESYAEEEESNAYFAPVIPLPDKIDVKTGEEDEDLLYIHRAKLFRMCEDGEWKERGLGDVKILRHKHTKNLRVVMRREKVLKICLNHALTGEIIYKPKDEKSWLFVVHDFSEGESVLERFALRFKNAEIAKAFHKAVTDSLAGTAEPINIQDREDQSAETSISNVNVTDSSSVSDDMKQLAKKLSLSYEFMTKETNCEGCRGCDPDNFDYGQPPNIETSFRSLPMTLPALTMPPPSTQQTAAQPTDVSEVTPTLAPSRVLLKASSLAANNSGGNTFGSFSIFGNAISANSTATTTTNTDSPGAPKAPEDGAARTGGGFLFGKSENSVFGQSLFGNTSSGIKPPTQSIFGGGLTTDLKFGGTSEGSIFGGGLTKPAVPFAGLATQNETPKVNPFSNAVLTGSSFGNTTGNLFGSVAGKTAAPIIGSEAKEKQISFADLSKTDESPTKDNKENIVTEPAGDGTKSSNESGIKFFDFSAKAGDTFASLATKSSGGNALGSTRSESGGFFGLTHQDDFKNFKSPTSALKQDKGADDSNDYDADSNYDPHYEPIIALPNEIVVSTGEENETKLFGERATLYRYDSSTKEWKERGVGELKILKHNIRNTYRMVMRREQIHKLVLNMNIGDDFSMDYMNEQKKSFIWANMNFAENADGELERLACRFKNIDLANKFFETIKQRNKDAKEDKSENSIEKVTDAFAETGVTEAH